MDIDYDDDVESLEIGVVSVNGLPSMFTSKSVIDDRYFSVNMIDESEDMSMRGDIITTYYESSDKYLHRGPMKAKWVLVKSDETYYLFSPRLQSIKSMIVYSFYNSRNYFILTGIRIINYDPEAEYELTSNNTFARRAILHMMNSLSQMVVDKPKKPAMGQIFDGTLNIPLYLINSSILTTADSLVNLLKSMLADDSWKLQKPSRLSLNKYLMTCSPDKLTQGIKLHSYITGQFEFILSSLDEIRRASVQRLIDHITMMTLELSA